MIVIGIDPGTSLTGFGVIQENRTGQVETIDYGVIKTQANQPLPERLVIIYSQLSELLKLHHPDCGAVEKLFFQRNTRTAMSVGQARGVVLLALAQAGIPISEYTPNEVKQAITGYGGAGKSQMQEMVQILLNMGTLPRPDDAADALAVAVCHLHKARIEAIYQEADE